MIPIVQLDPDNPFPLLITTTTFKNSQPHVENFRIEQMDWSDPVGAALRDAQQAELDARYGDTGKEPGIKPSAENIALFVVSYPVQILDSGSPDPSESIPIACGALRKLDQDYMELKRMYAIQSVRGSGAALSVLTALEHHARNTKGIKGIKLEAGNLHVEAIRFYIRNGYKEIDRFGHYKDVPWSRCFEKNFE
ncbi:acetyltransferase, GNAT family protein [Rhizoctonia solani AG-1 IB]|uniref:Acetyltransferase, GNAT family protein n=1 Tax=Thanatephorus cucumeris (strain AG1-IB / isolate 7/3/14) TaxID=1108050 RepID=A0A0B7FXQ9_THACB|nr:acetyltransferase, GNAT family protein [Rhizoctonia solani AG-1 IB]